jgi:type IV fimbrial biogenesis protein FimT
MASFNAARIHSQHGRGLLESLLCGAILAILVAQALPALNQFVLRQRLQGVAQTVMADLQQARAEAVRGGESVQFAIGQPSGGTCYVIHTGPVGGCRCEAQGRSVCSGEASVIKNIWLPAERAVTVRANVRNLSFHARQGMVTSTGSIDLEIDKAVAVRHVVSIAGRVRSCAPYGSIAGLKPCQS